MLQDERKKMKVVRNVVVYTGVLALIRIPLWSVKASMGWDGCMGIPMCSYGYERIACIVIGWYLTDLACFWEDLAVFSLRPHLWEGGAFDHNACWIWTVHCGAARLANWLYGY